MSIDKINLRKLLQLFFSDERLQRSLLLADIRGESAKASGDRIGGGDFYGPFWADVKEHAAGRSNLLDQTDDRIKSNKTRARLYPLLTEGFLEMWREKMRWRNEPFEFVTESVKAQLSIDKLRATVKIENTASVRVWDGSHRIILAKSPPYPTTAQDWDFGRSRQRFQNFDQKTFE